MALSDGSREDPHDHDWRVIAEVASEGLDDVGVVMDFQRLKSAMDEIVAGLGDTLLNSVEYFRRNNPSAENVAKYIYDKLEPQLPDGLELEHITIVEEPGCSARFAKVGRPFGRTGEIEVRPVGKEAKFEPD